MATNTTKETQESTLPHNFILKPELKKDLVLEEVIPDRQLVQELEKCLPHSFQEDLSSMSLFWCKDLLPDSAVKQLLSSLPGFSWKERLFIGQLPMHLHQNISHIIRELSDDSLVKEMELPVKIYTFRSKAPPVPSPPEEYYVRPLRKIHGGKVLTGWVGSLGEDQDVFSKILDKFPGVGIFKKSNAAAKQQEALQTEDGVASASQSSRSLKSTTVTTAQEVASSVKSKCPTLSVSGDPSLALKGTGNASLPEKSKENECVSNEVDETIESPENLVGWSVLKQGADIGMTYTTKGHRKQGLAKIATLEMLRQVLDNQLNAYIMITEDNDISIKMHEKLGFEMYTSDILLMFTPKK